MTNFAQDDVVTPDLMERIKALLVMADPQNAKVTTATNAAERAYRCLWPRHWDTIWSG